METIINGRQYRVAKLHERLGMSVFEYYINEEFGWSVVRNFDRRQQLFDLFSGK